MNERGTPFFFSNFPFDLKESDLWKIFPRWGRVSDVFISRRLNIKKQRFGFVRFLGVQNVRELEYHLNTIRIGSWKLNANRPKYIRATETRKEWNAKLKEKALEPEKEIKKVWRAKGTNTYANTVKNGNGNRAQSQNRGSLHAIHFKAEETPREWLNTCHIGRVSNLSKISSLNESFILGGLGFIKVKFLGGFHVLLKGENEMTIKDAIEENKEWFEEIFDTIIPWNEQFVAVDKLVRVRWRGLPLELWNYDCFKHIAALLGTLVEIDEATLALEEMEYARFRIRVSVGCEAKITSYMNINDVLYQVSVEEEYTVPDYKLCQCHWSEEFEDLETEVDSIESNDSVRSGSKDFEEVRKVAEETSMVDASKALPPTVQGCRNLGPSAPVTCCKPILARPVGSVSTPILRSILGSENLGSEAPTALTRAGVEILCGPSEMAQCVVNKVTCEKEEGRCSNKKQIEALSKHGPYAHRVALLWNGLLGSLVNSETFFNLHNSEQNEQPGAAIDAAHQEVTCNGKINARPNNLLEVTHGTTRPSAPTSAVAVKGGMQGSPKSISRVEDSLCGSETGEAYHSSLKQNSNETKHYEPQFSTWIVFKQNKGHLCSVR